MVAVKARGEEMVCLVERQGADAFGLFDGKTAAFEEARDLFPCGVVLAKALTRWSASNVEVAFGVDRQAPRSPVATSFSKTGAPQGAPGS